MANIAQLIGFLRKHRSGQELVPWLLELNDLGKNLGNYLYGVYVRPQCEFITGEA